MSLFNIISLYSLIGIVFSFFIEKTNEIFNKDKEDYYGFDWIGRIVLIGAWPIYFCIFLLMLIKNLIKK